MLKGLGEREATLHLETDSSGREWLRPLFADEVALAMSMNKHDLGDKKQLEQQAEKIRDAAVAFVNFAIDLLDVYWKRVGASPGELQPHPPDGGESAPPSDGR